jgi:hypothetical protein
MPIYVYQCCQCHKRAEEFRHIEQRDNAPVCCGKEMDRRIMPTMVQADIQPYMSVAIDKESGKRVGIQSRKQHREFLRRNDYVEVGNDFGTPSRRLDDGPADAPMVSVEQMKKMGFVEEAL